MEPHKIVIAAFSILLFFSLSASMVGMMFDIEPLVDIALYVCMTQLLLFIAGLIGVMIVAMFSEDE